MSTRIVTTEMSDEDCYVLVNGREVGYVTQSDDGFGWVAVPLSAYANAYHFGTLNNVEQGVRALSGDAS